MPRRMPGTEPFQTCPRLMLGQLASVRQGAFGYIHTDTSPVLIVVALSPEGRNTVEAHIMVPNEYLRSLPPPDSNDSSIMEQLTPDQQPK